MKNSLIDRSQKLKKTFGEVFTPPHLVDKMLDKLPVEIWSNPSLKWIDNSCGSGNFIVAILDRLMNGLTFIQDPDVRYRHIVENMLYFIDVQEKCLIESLNRIKNPIKTNCACTDALSFNYWGGLKFDVIVGNPPYNNKQSHIRKGSNGSNSLWDKFVELAIDKLLNKNGYLIYVHPSPWRKPEHKLWKLMTSKQIIYLDINSKKSGQKIFGASTRYDWYLIQNKPYAEKTIVCDENKNTKEIDLKDLDFLPNYMIDEVFKVVTKQNGCDVIFSRSNYGSDKKHMRKNMDEEFKYPCVHSMTKDGLDFWYSNTNKNGCFGVPKVILSFNEKQYPYNDFNGEYGLTQISFGLPITSKEEGDKLVQAINSEKFKEIINATKWSMFQTEWRMFKFFKRDFWKYFT